MHRVTLVLAVVFVLGAWCFAEEAKVPLKIETPEEILAGTPPDVLLFLYPNLAKPPKGKHPDLLVPEGTVNLALKKKVTSSDPEPVIGEIEYVTDGEKEGSEDSFVELAPQTQWVQIDLEKECRIYAILIWHFFREARSYHDVVVQVADDAKFTENVRTVYNNDQDNSSKLGLGKSRAYIETNLGQLIDVKGVKARYVRLYSKGNTANALNHYVEVEVFGKPVP
jgi:hypothetical protein